MNPSQLFLANEQSFNDGFDMRLITDAVVFLCVSLPTTGTGIE
jgi:hypothetical protein